MEAFARGKHRFEAGSVRLSFELERLPLDAIGGDEGQVVAAVPARRQATALQETGVLQQHPFAVGLQVGPGLAVWRKDAHAFFAGCEKHRAA